MNNLIRNHKENELHKKLFDGTITAKMYDRIQTALFAIKTTESWRGRRDLSITIYKEEKEALNAMVFFILLIEKKVKEGYDVNFDACIAYVIKRVLRKALTWDAKPANKADLCKKVKNYLEREKEYVRKTTIEGTSEKFVDALDILESGMSKKEEYLYSVAKHFTNWVEFLHIKKTIFRADRREIERQLIAKLRKYHVSKYVSLKLARLVLRLSWSRNVVRWQGCGPTLNCNILCHMFETAILGWFMTMDYNINECPENKKKVSPKQVFLAGLYHDISEIWTDDIPSSCKREIAVEMDGTIRPATEQQEREALAKHFYPVFSDEVAAYFKEYIMLEDIADKNVHHLVKMADYFSADFELFWHIKQGSRNKLFFKILKDSSENNKDRTFENRVLLREWIKKIKNNEFL